MSFTKIKTQRSRLADEVYEQILSAITTRVIDPEKKIVQEQLAAAFNISRTPVREALFRLQQEGILEIREKGGFYVRSISDSEVREIYQTRKAIEGYSIRLLTDEKDETIFTKIEKILGAEEDRKISTPEELYQSNRKIHRAFVEHTGNKYLLDMFDQMWNRSISYFLFQTIPEGDLQETEDDHHQLCALMRSGDATAAEAAMRSHIEDGLQLQLDHMD